MLFTIAKYNSDLYKRQGMSTMSDNKVNGNKDSKVDARSETLKQTVKETVTKVRRGKMNAEDAIDYLDYWLKFED